MLAGNTISNNANGVYSISSTQNRLIGNSIYSNSGYDLRIENGTNDTVIEGGQIGYTSAGVSAPAGIGEVLFDNTTVSSVTIRRALLNPSPGILTSGIAMPGSSLLYYSTAPGVVQLYGDYQVSGTTLTFDYSSALLTSTTTTPKVMRGTGHTLTVNTVYDSNAISQVITATFNGTDWVVTGSSTPGTLCTISGTSGSSNCPNSSARQLNLTITGASPVTGDVIDFGLLAASADASTQKKLLFGPSAAGLNNGRSKLTIAAGAGIYAVGSSSMPTVIDWLNSSSTFYTFVDSGSLAFDQRVCRARG